MLTTLIAPLRVAAKVLLVVIGVPAALVLVPAVETVRGIAEEWALAFRSLRTFVRSARAVPS
jgi:hypothetical protein